VAGLSERQRLVLRMRYVDELTQSQIGAHLGVSQMQVSRILRAIVDRLRLELFAEDDERLAQVTAA
jgi:RNA polymerase sigma-B factor